MLAAACAYRSSRMEARWLTNQSHHGVICNTAYDAEELRLARHWLRYAAETEDKPRAPRGLERDAYIALQRASRSVERTGAPWTQRVGARARLR